MEPKVKRVGERKCIACGEIKSGGKFWRHQVACIECQEGNVDYEAECPECHEMRKKDEFVTVNVCKFCYNRHVRENVIKKNETTMIECAGCKEEKSKPSFRRGQIVCQECEKDPTISYEKECIECKETKSNKMFRLNRKKCMDCERADGRDYRRTTDKAEKWAENNREKMSQLQHKHYESHKTEIRQAEKTRLETDPHFRMIKNYRLTICTLISGTTKSCGKLAISRDAYLKWFEFCFEEGMTVDNHVEVWQVDHVIALDCLKTKKVGSIEFEDATNLSCLLEWYNTMPVLCKDNMKKNKYHDSEKLTVHFRKVKAFIKTNKTPLKLKMSDNWNTYKSIVRTVLDTK